MIFLGLFLCGMVGLCQSYPGYSTEQLSSVSWQIGGYPVVGATATLVFGTGGSSGLLELISDSTYEATYDLVSGNFVWQDAVQDTTAIFTFSGDAGLWTLSPTSEPSAVIDQWTYSASSRTWTNVVSRQVWTFTGTPGDGNHQGTWSCGEDEWLLSAGLIWQHVPTGSLWIYGFSTGSWTLNYTPGGLSPTLFPPLPLVEMQVFKDMLDTLLSQGVAAESGNAVWTISSDADTVINASGDFSAIYGIYSGYINGTLIDTFSCLSGCVSFSYDLGGGAITWRRSVYPWWTESWSYNNGLALWSNGVTGEQWTYNQIAYTWTSQDSTTLWAYNPYTGVWTESFSVGHTTNVWSYDPSTGYWGFYDGTHTWSFRYYVLSDTWVQVSENEGSWPDLPPTVVVQANFIATVYDAFRYAGTFETGGSPVGWSTFGLVDGVWTATNSTRLETLAYHPEWQTLVWQNMVTGESFTFYQATGAWSWENSLVAIADYASRFDGNTHFYEYGLSSPTWTYTPSSRRWQNAGASITWQQGVAEWVWNNTTTGVTWTFSPTDNTWTESAHSSVWLYHTSGAYWEHISGSGGPSPSTQIDQFPPNPVWQYVYTRLAHYALVVSTVPSTPPIRNFRPLAAVEGGTVSASFSGSGHSTFTYTSSDGAVELNYDLTTGAYTWVNAAAEPTVTSTFNQTTATWTQGSTSWTVAPSIPSSFVGAWTPSGGLAATWTQELSSDSWRCVATGRHWKFDRTTGSWLDAAMHMCFKYSETEQEWNQVYGDTASADDESTMPPAPVRQAAFIGGLVDAVMAANIACFSTDRNFVITNRGGGVWAGTNSAGRLKVQYNPASLTNQLVVSPVYTSGEAWLNNIFSFSVDTNGSWSWQSLLNKYAPESFAYNAELGAYTVTTGYAQSIWNLTIADGSWTDGTKTWSTSQNWSTHWNVPGGSGVWVYNSSNDTWGYTADASQWQYDYVTQRWLLVSGTSVTPPVPPIVAPYQNFATALLLFLTEIHAFTSRPPSAWQAGTASWSAPDAYGAATGYYDARATYPYTWRDYAERNVARYNPTTGDFYWVHDQTLWRFLASTGRWQDAASSTVWQYVSTGTPLWYEQGNRTQIWQQGDSANEWVDMANEVRWTYHVSFSVGGMWEQEGQGYWVYDFQTGDWLPSSTSLSTYTATAVFPPLPIVQTVFLQAMQAGGDTFFADPVYAAAQLPPSQTQDPLYGTRPLAVGASYDRYNSSAVLVNAPLALKNVWFVHSDVSRNLGFGQLPSVSPTALPTIIGGEAASLFSEIWGPSITLQNSTIACHESLVSAGVRFVVQENDSYLDDNASGSDNISTLLLFNRGRSLDALRRRGAVFQLGSTANTMVDGTITASLAKDPGAQIQVSSLRDSFINIYRQQSTADNVTGLPTPIQLTLQTAQEPSVAAGDQSTAVLYVAGNSHINIGWPTTAGSVNYVPWSVPADGIALTDEGAFDAGATGGGCLMVANKNWCISGRNTHNYAPGGPLLSAGEGGVVYVDYGGSMAMTGNSFLTLDTTVGVRLGFGADAGVFSIPSSQLVMTPAGRIDGYGFDFVHGVAGVGASYAGNMPLTNVQSIFGIGRPFQSSQLALVKSPRKTKARKSEA